LSKINDHISLFNLEIYSTVFLMSVIVRLKHEIRLIDINPVGRE